MGRFTPAMRDAAQALYADEGGWHVMSRKHGGGPSWRWYDVGIAQKPGKWIKKQQYDLQAQDLLPQYLQSLCDLKLKVRYKSTRFHERLIVCRCYYST